MTQGSVAPWWEQSQESVNLLLEKGIQYGIDLLTEHRTSLINRPPLSRPFWNGSRVELDPNINLLIIFLSLTYFHSCQAYYMRDEDTWTKIDFKGEAATWMKPLRRGKETGLGLWFISAHQDCADSDPFIVQIPVSWCAQISSELQ